MKQIKIIITAMLLMASLYTNGQGVLGSDIYIKNLAGTRGYVYRDGTGMKMVDSLGNVYLNGIKLKMDSLYTRLAFSYDSSLSRRVVSLGTGGNVIGSISNTTFAVTNAGTFAVQSTNQANSGVDIGDVTINNASGGSAVNIQDGGNTITVDGTVAATQSGTWNIANVSGTVSLPTGAATESTLMNAYSEMTDQSANYFNPTKLKTDSIYTRLGTGVTVNSHAVTNAGTFAVQVDSSTQRTTVKMDSTLQRKGVVIIGGSITATAGATAIFDSTYAAVTMDTAGLGAKANSATVGWQSDSVGLRQHKVTDVKIGISLDMASGAPANDKAVYVYVYPLWYDGSAMNFTDGGTGTLPSGANSSYTIASPNDLTLLGVLSYTTSDMVVSKQFMLSSVYPTMPDGFGIIIVNYSGVALAASTHKVVYSLVTKVQR